MSAPPFMPFYVADYLSDTRHLSTEQHGAYLLLLMAMWRAGGRLPNEGEKLARIVGLTPAKWARLEADILAFFDVEGDEIGHRRIQKEFEKYTRTCDRRKQSGAKGGAAKALKNNDPPLASATDLPEQNPSKSPPNQNQNQKEIVSTTTPASETPPAVAVAGEDDWPKGSAKDHARLLVEAVGSPWLDPNKSLDLNTTHGRLAAWKRDGASWEFDVLPVVQKLAGNRRSRISSWKFFDAAIAQSIADNRAALEIPEAGKVVRLQSTGPPNDFLARQTAIRDEALKRVLKDG